MQQHPLQDAPTSPGHRISRLTVMLAMSATLATGAQTPAPKTPSTPPAANLESTSREELSAMAPERLHEHARALAAADKLPAAKDAYRMLLARQGDLAAARNELAAVLLRSGENAAAAEQYRELLRVDPKDADAHHKLGVALYR